MIADEQGKTHRGDGGRLHDYYCYRMPVLAPVRGRVVKVVDDVEENPAGSVDGDRNWGNLVLLEDPRGFCVELSHFAHRTIRVQEGQWVERGAMLGLCGNSGYSAQPHIHVQVQADARVGAATLPFSFVSYRQGDVYHANDLPRETDVVEPLYRGPATRFRGDLPSRQHPAVRGPPPRAAGGTRSPFRATRSAADGTHYFQSRKGLALLRQVRRHVLLPPSRRRRSLAAAGADGPAAAAAVRSSTRLAWKDSIPLGTAVSGFPRLLARLGNLVWPRLAHVEIAAALRRSLLRRVVAEHPLLGGKRKARVELDLRGGLLPSRSAMSNSNASAPKAMRRRPVPSQPQPHKGEDS